MAKNRKEEYYEENEAYYNDDSYYEGDYYDDGYDDGYQEMVDKNHDPKERGRSSDKKGKGLTAFLIIITLITAVAIVACWLLMARLKSANAEVASLRTEVDRLQSVQWEAPSTTPTVPTETIPIPDVPQGGSIPTPTPASTLIPEATPTPAPTPTPSPTPVVTAGGLPAWISENDVKHITRLPKDDEWYGSPGKLYVTATMGLNLRTGIRTDINNIITQIKYGSEVMVYAASGTMRFVQDPKGNFGWCSNNLMSNEPPAGVNITPFTPVQTPTPVSTPAPVTTPPDTVNLPVPEAPSING